MHDQISILKKIKERRQGLSLSMFQELEKAFIRLCQGVMHPCTAYLKELKEVMEDSH